MSRRQPLDLVQKWQTLQYWVNEEPHLTRSAIVVLARLLERQNTKTGQCDLSKQRLLEETGICKRSVSNAFCELEARGAVIRHRSNARACNKFLIYSTDELKRNQHSIDLKRKKEVQSGVQSVADKGAAHCLKHMQPTAPETIKETIKKKGMPESAVTRAVKSKRQRSACIDFGLGEFERRAAKIFEREGFGYEGLISLPNGKMERVFNLMKQGECSFSKAVAELLQTYREIQ